ncbi:MAG: NAD(P)H-dependent oxidoreductase subunit E [Pirellulaceae bacterium]|nr:NAD(P)H-dependent oxidoreductase subunit E [Pirellulaceae bacterium]
MADRILTAEMIDAIKAFIPRYPSKQAVTLPALHIVNEHLRHVPLQAVVEIAEILELHPAQVQDTLSFYGYFKQDKPAGRCRVWVCRSISCALRGADQLLAHLSDTLHLQPGETTPDGRITLEYAECLGACEHAPCILANNDLHKSVSSEQADELVKSIA